MNLSPEDRTRINELYFSILKNKARLREYYEYEEILYKYGYSKKQIANYLSKGNFENIDDLYDARNPRINQPKIQIDIKNWEPLVVGGLIGLGLGLIIRELAKKQS